MSDAATPSPAPEQQDKAEPYAVGYKRPPRHTQFKKGQSGNRKGRPKGAKGVSTILNALMDTRRPVRIDGQDKMMSGTEIMLQQLAKKAMSGDHRATILIFDRLQDRETKEVLAAAAEAAVSNAHDEGISETEAAILIHHYRSELMDQGLDEQAVALVLETFGLAPPEKDR